MGEKIIRKVKGMSWTAKISLMLVFTLILSVAIYGVHTYKLRKAEAASGDVILLWDTANGAVPGGWTNISGLVGDPFYGVFPRAAASYGAATAGADTHTHSLTYSSTTGPSATTTTLDVITTPDEATSNTHTHGWGNITSGAGDVRPPFKNLVFIRATNPVTIPANAIGIFDTGSLPSGWTRYAALDGNYLRGFSDNATGGAATHTHTAAVTSAASAAYILDSANTTSVARVTHTHSVSGSLSTLGTNAQPFLEVVFAYNSSGGPASIPTGLIAMFDAAPTGNWSIVSDVVPWTGSFLKGATTYGGTGGSSVDHNHGASQAFTSGGPSAVRTIGAAGARLPASDAHTHGVTYSIADSGNPLPVYRNTIFAKYTPPAATTTIADGTNPSSVTIAPGAAITDLDAFTLQTSAGTDTVTAVTVTLGPAGAFNNIAQVDITDNSNLARCTAVTNPVSNTITFPGGTCTLNGGIPVIAASPTTYKVRITPKTHALMPVPPGASYATTGTVTSFTCTNAQAGTDSGSATITIDNLSPNGATATSGTAGNQKVTVNWTTSSSSDFNATSGSVIYRWAAGSAGAEVPAEGSAPAIGSTNGTATAACVVSSAASTPLSKIDGSGGSAECTNVALTNGQQYTYKAFQKDTNGNYDVGVSIGTFTPTAPATTTIADGTNPSSVTIAPGAAITDLDAFTLQTSAGTDTVTAVTVTLGPAGAFNNITQVDITDNSNVARCTAVSNPVSNTITFPGGTCTLNGGIPVIAASPTTYKVRITPKTHVNMPVPPGASYATTGTVTSFTCTNAQAGTDSGSATITIDNLSPNGATATSGTAGNQKVTINWTTSNSGDFNATNGSVIYRWAAGSAGAEVPAEGSAPAIGSTNGTATAACVVSSAASTPLSKIDGSGGSAECTNVALTNGQQYTYKAFQKDTNGNYDVGVSIGTFTPAAACTRNQPTLDLSPNSGTITTDGGNKVYTLTIMNNDSGCTATTFNLSKTDSNSTNFNASVLSQNSVALNSGESNNSITVTVYAKSGETTGTNNTYVTSALDANHAAQNSDTVVTNINIVNPLLHNSVNATLGTRKWDAQGGWGILGGKYGEFTCGTCHEPRATNIKGVKSTVTAPTSPAEDFPGGAGSSVNFQSFTTSATDMGNDSGNSPRASSTRICEVCHTYDVTQVSGVNAHPYSVGSLLTNHYSADNTDCTSCHKHNVGFKGMGCDSCHGNPPTDTSSGGPTGLADDPGPTGSTTAGSHSKHAITLSYACTTCHTNYAMPETPMQIIDIGFNMFDKKDGTGTTYGAANEVNASDDYRGRNGTTIVDDNTRNCSNLYCHGNFTGGLNDAPTWGGVAGCGTCHGKDAITPPTKINHPRHAGSGAGGLSVACTDCHGVNAGDQSHVNADVHWELNTGSSKFGANAKYKDLATGNTGAVAPSASYGACTNVYCHSNVQNGTGTAGPTSYGTPTWGAASVSCAEGVTGCHGNAPATPTANNAHSTHTTGSYIFACSACHNNGGYALTANHANVTLNMTISATYGGTYSQNDHTPGSGGYGNCATVYCHGNYAGSGGASLTPSWAGAVACGDCHKNLNTDPPTPGSHGRHAGQAAGQLNLACAKCHPSRSLGDGHVDLSVQWQLSTGDLKFGASAIYRTGASGSTGAKAPSSPYGTCGSVYCHSSVQAGDGTSAPTYVSQQWGVTPPLACSTASCHGNPPATPTVNSAHTTHTGSSVDFTYNYTCSSACHKSAGDETAKHADRNIDMDLTDYGASAAYSQAGTPQNGFGTCSSVYCHGSATPAWNAADGTITCSSCHSSMGAGTGGAAYIARHQRHTDTVTYKIACLNCHNVTTHAKGLASAVAPEQAAEVAFTTSTGTKQYNGGGTTFSYYNMTANPYTGAGVTPTAYAKGAAGGTDNSFPWTTGQCGNIWCHSNANPWNGTNSYVSPQWTGAGTSCTVCHAGAATGTTLSAKHEKHLMTYLYTCDKCHVNTNAVGSNTSLKVFPNSHLNGAKNVNFDTWVNSSATYDTVNHQCANTYCHSNGTTTSVGGSPTHAAYLWNASPTCASCHGNPPSYASGSPKANSHTKHSSYTCDKCHNSTTTTGVTITTPANHSNKTYNIAAGTGVTIASYTPVTPPSILGGTCTTISCHGGNNATWGGASLKCSNCHSGASDVDDYTYNNGTVAKVNSTQWGYAGHGKASGAYDKSANPAANFDGAVTTGDSCQYCHLGSVAHGVGTNPLRLANYDGVTYGWNNNCLICHRTGSSGYDPDGAGGAYASKNASAASKIDKYHYGADHAGGAGGKFCWDCHDPHGDSTSTAGPIEMIHLKAAQVTDGTYGVPTTQTATTIVFSDNTLGAAAGGFAMNAAPYGQGVCNACHTATTYYKNTTGASGHGTGLCTPCHKHSGDTTYDAKAFEGAGDCVGCHTVAQGTRRAVKGEFGLAFGHHDATVTNADCVVCHMEGTSVANPARSGLHAGVPGGIINLRDPDLNTEIASGAAIFARNVSLNTLEAFAVSIQNNLCLKCHDANGANYLGAGQTGTDGLHTPSNPFVTGVAPANVDAHFATTNATFHPIKGTQNNDYCDISTMNVPWNQINKTPGLPLEAGNLITCFDCHAKDGASGNQASTIVAHGTNESDTLRATYDATAASSTKLCVVCHKQSVYWGVDGGAVAGQGFTHMPNLNVSGLDRDNPISAWASGGRHDFNKTNVFPGCTNCHGTTTYAAVRPSQAIRAKNAHGFNTIADDVTTTWPSGDRPYSFIRCSNDGMVTDWSYTTKTCVGAGTMCGRGTSAVYTPGGTY